MSEIKKNKHLTYEERTYIEIGLNNNKKICEIAKGLNKDATTVSKEIQKNSFKKYPSIFNNSKNLCKNKMKCKVFDCTIDKKCYEEEICININKASKVCNGCETKNKCRKIKKYYYAKIANDKYLDKLVNNRMGINISETEIYDIDKLITPLIKDNNQSIYQVFVNNPDTITFSKPTFYKYIELGIFSVRNIDLQRKVKYKKRKKSEKTRIRRETKIRKNRTYKDFKKYIEKNPNAQIVEMDTVEGTKGGNVFLTLLFRGSNLMLIYLLEKKNIECVINIFNDIKNIIGKENYEKLFEVILTDNGSEFFDPESIEQYNNEKVISLFYCDPSASWQKGSIEKNHEYIRYILPKGSSFDDLSQEVVNLIMNNINNVPREKLDEKTPYETFEESVKSDILDKFNLEKIEKEKVNLSPNLVKMVTSHL